MPTERLAEVVPDALEAIHEVLERHHVTEEEWMAVLAFLTEIGRADEFVLLSDVTRTSVLIDALSHEGDESGATASDVEGPMYTVEPPFRTKIYEEYEGMSPDDDVLFVRGRVTSTAGEPLPGAVVDVWQTGPAGGYDVWDERQPEGNFRGRIKAEDGRQLRVPDDAAEAVHGADHRPGGAVPGGGRPASVAARAHPLQGHRAGPPDTRDAGVLPGRPVPGQRHDRRGEAGARAARREGRRPPHVRLRHHAGTGLSFDNLGEVTALARGEWPAGAPVGEHWSVTEALPRLLALLDEVELKATFFVEGLERRAVSGRAARARRGRPRGRVPRLAPRALGWAGAAP